MTDEEILSLPMDRNDAEARTIREYLQALLRTLWTEYDGFSGKRPFGNSGWKSDVDYALVRGKALNGEVVLDEDGHIEDARYDRKEADAIVLRIIASL